MGTGFYGSNDPTNSIKALKEQTHKKTKPIQQNTKMHSKLRNTDNTNKTKTQVWSPSTTSDTIRSAITENPMLYANFTTLSFIEPELLLIEISHGGNREFYVFLRK